MQNSDSEEPQEDRKLSDGVGAKAAQRPGWRVRVSEVPQGERCRLSASLTLDSGCTTLDLINSSCFTWFPLHLGGGFRRIKSFIHSLQG